MTPAVIVSSLLLLTPPGIRGPAVATASPAAPSPTPPMPCLPAKAAPGIGVVDPFHIPKAQATQLNADGKVSYRQGHWDDARSKYRAAEASDPDFLAPALNVACSFVRQERFAEAMTEVLRLLDRAYLPWSAEVLSAADLGALKVRNGGKELRAALDAGRSRWAEGLTDDVIFLARMRPSLRLGDPSTTEGTLVLGPHQEIFAWSPRTLRYRQLSAEEGRALAVARSSDRRRIAYVTAEKLIRGSDKVVSLRGVVVKEWELGTLTSTAAASVEGDVQRLDILTVGPGFAYRIDRGSGDATFRIADRDLEAMAVPRTARPSLTLTGRGVVSNGSPLGLPGGCVGTVREVRANSSVSIVEVRGGGRGKAPDLTIGGPFGASLSGLPIP